MKSKPIITPTKNGPLIIKHLTKFTNSKKNTLEPSPEMALCRCGASNSKPYCDGTHGKIGFNSDKSIDRKKDNRSEFKGEKLTISDNPGICSHAGYCDGNSPKVFWTFEKDRVAHPDKDDTAKTIKTIRMCPSGALAYKLNGKLQDKYHDQEEIHVSKNGPYFIRGGIILENKDQPDAKEHYALCRCGLSKNKPYCDGNHRKKFKDDEN
jgi:CDGSH-type Zn-finger protein